MNFRDFAHAKAIQLGKEVVRMTTAAGSGHPSSGLSMMHAVVTLMYDVMRWDTREPAARAADREARQREREEAGAYVDRLLAGPLKIDELTAALRADRARRPVIERSMKEARALATRKHLALDTQRGKAAGEYRRRRKASAARQGLTRIGLEALPSIIIFPLRSERFSMDTTK